MPIRSELSLLAIFLAATVFNGGSEATAQAAEAKLFEAATPRCYGVCERAQALDRRCRDRRGAALGAVLDFFRQTNNY